MRAAACVVWPEKYPPSSTAVRKTCTDYPGAQRCDESLENEAFYSQIVELNIEGKSEDVTLKISSVTLQAIVLHMDFLRVSKNTKLQTRVPLHFINEDTCVGVKLGGGLIAHSMTELEISCLPKDLPEYLEVDMENVELGQTLHISDIKLPEGVESVALSHGEDHDLPIAAVNKPKAAAVEEEEVAEESDSGDADAAEDDSDKDASEE